VLPDAGLHDTVVTLPVGSDPEAVNVAVVEGAPPDVCSVWLLGQVIVGGGNWLAVTKKVHDFEFSALSNAVHVTELAPDENDEPLGGVQDVLRMPLPSVTDEML
jgi:hypothetical protein